MGCDIHMFIEKKASEKYDIWEQVALYRVNKNNHKLEVAPFYDGRDYELFSLLAGVRGWHEPFVDLRGLPNNMSSEVEKESAWYESFSHSHTWYDLFELKLFIQDFKNKNENEDGIFERLDGLYDFIIDYLDFAGEYIFNIKPNQYRIIMWFDS